MRQDNCPPHDRRSGRYHPGHRQHWGPHRQRCGPQRSRRGHGLPELRPLPSSVRLRQHGVLTEDAEGQQGGDREEGARSQDDLNVTTIYVTHDQVEAMTLGDRVAVIKKGRLQQVDSSQTLYDHPVNLFVAGFIGSPAMNMVEATITREDERLYVCFGGLRLVLDEKIEQARPDLKKYEGRTVILGIRPEDIYDAGLQEAPAERRMQVIPDLIESLASEALLHVMVDAPIILTEDVRELAVDVGVEQLERLEKERKRGRSKFVAAVSPQTRAKVGQPMEIAVDTARVHAFDPETGLGIWGAVDRRLSREAIRHAS